MHSPADVGFWLQIFDFGTVVTTALTVLGSVIVGRMVLQGELRKAEVQRENSVWEGSNNLRENLQEQLTDMRDEQAQLRSDVISLHNELAVVPYLRAYARILWETWERPPDPPAPPPIVATALGIETSTHEPSKPQAPETNKIRDQP